MGLAINPPTPNLRTLADVNQEYGLVDGMPVTNAQPTWSEALQQWVMAPDGVLPFIPSTSNPAFPGGGPAETVAGQWIAAASASSPYAYVHDADGSIGVSALAGVPTRAVWSPDGTRVAFAHAGGDRLTVIDVATGTAETGWPTLPGDADQGLAWSPGADKLAVSHAGGNRLTVIDVATKTVETGWPVFGVSIRALAWSMDGARLAAGHLTDGVGRQLTVMMAADGSIETGWPDPFAAPVGLCWSPDGSRLSGSGNNGLRVIDIASRTEEPLWTAYNLPGNGTVHAWSPDGSRVAAGFTSGGGGLRVIDTETTDVEPGWPELSGRPDGIGWSADGSRLGVANNGADKLVVYSVATKAVESGWPTIAGNGEAVAFAFDPGNAASQ